jgi:dihydropteroate synthase
MFFPGGCIGDLAVNGTVNDLAMSGATPLYLSTAFILQEGTALADIDRIARAMGAAAQAAGVAGEQIVLDPGPDFAKTPAETVAVLRALGRLEALGRPLLLAISRKYFLGAITGRPPAERLPGTLAAAGWAADAGAAILRVHDVGAVRDFLAVRRVLAGEEELPAYDGDDEDLKWIRVRSGP